ncbi:AAA family ATPase [Mycolicibacterium austroafricanum]|uniref:AAA family ATPase n=1 Tax=Mycolicibacterium austroafricanum TaxID=39687 RepID=UPI000CF99B6B|nr:AAA family ATPase [Mycolicibacterium austroafricanum]PQP41780.1 AAA family ATPase [Mycolicibacterium austroafricanum]
MTDEHVKQRALDAVERHRRDRPPPTSLPTFDGLDDSQALGRPEDGPHHEPETAVDGATFVLDQPAGIPALWGRDAQVIWPAGEALMIAGGQGLGKTSIAILIVRELLGLGDGSLIGLPIHEIDCRILYLAMDRPKQIARAAGRVFRECDRHTLAKQLTVWSGPPPRDLAANPALLARMADYYDAGVVIVDSLKDAAVRLSEDAVGAQWNRARQHLLSQGCQLLELHHTKKRNPQGPAVPSVDDVYGSTWLTSGCGSIVLLNGDPGDPIVSFRHIKQPAEEVGPYRLLHDQAAGVLTIEHSVDLVDLVRASGVDGLTARDAAAAITEKSSPGRADIEKARRRLDQLAAAGVLVRLDGRTNEHGGKARSAWFLAEVSQSRPITERGKPAGQSNHALFEADSNHAVVTPITRPAKPQVEQSRKQS